MEPRSLLGIRSANYSGTFVVNPHPTEDFVRAPAAFHIVIPTTGVTLRPIACIDAQPLSVSGYTPSHQANVVQAEGLFLRCWSLWNRSSIPR